MQLNNELVFNHGLPKKNRLLQLLLYLKFPLLIPGINTSIKKLFKRCPTSTYFIPGFFCLYGNIYAEENVALNDTLCLDYAPIYIGANSKLSFQNMLITGEHKLDDFKTVVAKPITIGKNVWITSRCMILPGVTIGDNVIVGAGSVVTRDIPPHSFAAGNPARVIKKI